MIDIGRTSILWASHIAVTLVVDGIKKQAEKAVVSKRIVNVYSWHLLQYVPPGFCLEFLP